MYVFYSLNSRCNFCLNGVFKGKGLDPGAEPPGVKLCKAPSAPDLGLLVSKLTYWIFLS